MNAYMHTFFLYPKQKIYIYVEGFQPYALDCSKLPFQPPKGGSPNSKKDNLTISKRVKLKNLGTSAQASLLSHGMLWRTYIKDDSVSSQ